MYPRAAKTLIPRIPMIICRQQNIGRDGYILVPILHHAMDTQGMELKGVAAIRRDPHGFSLYADSFK
jgi:hypothetical protein